MEQSNPVRTRLNRKGKPSIIRWQGLLCGSTRLVRIVTFIALALATASLAFTQFGFIGLGVPGNYSAYGVLLLAPIALAALMLGVWPGTLMGLVAGGVLYLHARYQPLDYYEVNFVTPVSAIVLFTVTAFFLGLLLAIALRKNPPLWRRVIYMALVFAFASFMFSATFTINVFMQLAIQLVEMASTSGVELDPETVNRYALVATGQMGSLWSQIWLDGAFMFASCTVLDIAVRKVLAAQGNFSLSTKFRGWLLLVVSRPSWLPPASASRSLPSNRKNPLKPACEVKSTTS